MKEFTYTVTDPAGIHARPAGLLVKQAQPYASEVSIEKEDKTANAKSMLSVMGLGAKNGDTVKVVAEGADEDNAIAELEAFFKENL
ncbi:MAG: HPr family phosphocarrier protein [Eubacteriaceae bacterium]|nr:HPr family phosphocarrier protein [Eubacteriaceae bacterium]MDD4508173.1 HPr family phosphocarrier protein [Eubacteriaceae bacterium]